MLKTQATYIIHTRVEILKQVNVVGPTIHDNLY